MNADNREKIRIDIINPELPISKDLFTLEELEDLFNTNSNIDTLESLTSLSITSLLEEDLEDAVDEMFALIGIASLKYLNLKLNLIALDYFIAWFKTINSTGIETLVTDILSGQSKKNVLEFSKFILTFQLLITIEKDNTFDYIQYKIRCSLNANMEAFKERYIDFPISTISTYLFLPVLK